MTLEKMLTTLESLGDDVIYHFGDNNTISVDINDFEGFDHNWDEVFRDYDNPKEVHDFINMLSRECEYEIEEFYTIYGFKDFNVVLGYTSYDI